MDLSLPDNSQNEQQANVEAMHHEPDLIHTMHQG